jgi:hypothetical protein
MLAISSRVQWILARLKIRSVLTAMRGLPTGRLTSLGGFNTEGSSFRFRASYISLWYFMMHLFIDLSREKRKSSKKKKEMIKGSLCKKGNQAYEIRDSKDKDNSNSKDNTNTKDNAKAKQYKEGVMRSVPFASRRGGLHPLSTAQLLKPWQGVSLFPQPVATTYRCRSVP